MLSLALALSLISCVAANQIPKLCNDHVLSLTVKSDNYKWGLPNLETNYDATAFNTDLARWDANTTLNPISGYGTATADYTISGTFCAPRNGGTGTVLLATHGFGFDRR
jgi:hypothetical protein